MRPAASEIDRLAMLCETSTRYTTDSLDEPNDTTGRASASASAASSSERSPACSSCCRRLKFVRPTRRAIHTSGMTASSHNAPGLVRVMLISDRYAPLPCEPFERDQAEGYRDRVQPPRAPALACGDVR